MALEEEFAVALRDEDLGRVRTVGDLQSLVVAELAHLSAGGTCPTSRAFYRLRGALVAVTGVDRRRVTPATPLGGLLPRPGRRRRWRDLQEVSGLALPPLRFPRSTETTLAALALMVWLGPVVVFALCRGMALAGGWLCLAGPLAAFLFSTAAKWALEHFTETLPAQSPVTVGELATQIAASWSTEDIWGRVQAVVVRELHVPPEHVTPDTDLARDLKVG